MDLLDKIEYIIDNEGCELADGYSGLQSFLNYCLPHKEWDMFLNFIKDRIDEHYKGIKEEIEKREFKGFLFNDLPDVCHIHSKNYTPVCLFKVGDKLLNSFNEEVEFSESDRFDYVP